MNGKKAVLPTVNGRRGHPALIRMDLLADILAYEGSAGGGGLRGFWKQLGDAMMELPVDDRGCIMAVSYTHLDVYKRQVLFWLLAVSGKVW